MSNYVSRFVPERRAAVLWGFSVFLWSQVWEVLVVIGPLLADLAIFPILWLLFKMILAVSLLPTLHPTSSPDWPLHFYLPAWLLSPVVPQPSLLDLLTLPNVREAGCPDAQQSLSPRLGLTAAGGGGKGNTTHWCPLGFRAGKQGSLGDVWQFPVGTWRLAWDPESGLFQFRPRARGLVFYHSWASIFLCKI